MKPRTKAPKNEQLTGTITGDLAAYASEGLLQHPLSERTVYRYKGVLLAYQKALQGAFPTLQTSVQFLLQMQRDKFSESAINVHRAALKGFHDWRGEKLDFQVKRSRHQSRYIGDEMVKLLLEAAKPVPIDYLILRLMSDAGLRRDEVVGG